MRNHRLVEIREGSGKKIEGEGRKAERKEVTRKSSCGKPQEAYRPRHNLSKHIPILGVGGGYLPRPGGGEGTNLGQGEGYLTWPGDGVPTLAGGGVPTWGGGTYLGEGVPTLAGERGTFLPWLGRGYLP